eukprot:scaffold14470_cov107-Isochrysis_galbana.AAC.5
MPNAPSAAAGVCTAHQVACREAQGSAPHRRQPSRAGRPPPPALPPDPPEAPPPAPPARSPLLQRRPTLLPHAPTRWLMRLQLRHRIRGASRGGASRRAWSRPRSTPRPPAARREQPHLPRPPAGCPASCWLRRLSGRPPRRRTPWPRHCRAGANRRVWRERPGPTGQARRSHCSPDRTATEAAVETHQGTGLPRRGGRRYSLQRTPPRSPGLAVGSRPASGARSRPPRRTPRGSPARPCRAPSCCYPLTCVRRGEW